LRFSAVLGRVGAVNRIEQRFRQLRQQGRKGLVVYIGAGDPDLVTTRRLALAFETAGVDVLELGVPFSDPLADGVVNQLAAQRGLQSGTTPRGVLDAVAALRRESELPIVRYIYYNLIHRHGPDRFIEEAAAAGVDGLLVLDLPPEEAGDHDRLMRAARLSAIHLVAPTTPEARIGTIMQHATGFVYYISREGVTGMQNTVAASIGDKTAQIRRHTDLPIAIGFGISNVQQAREVARHGDAIVVGSAVVDRIARGAGEPALVESVAGFVRGLAEGIRS